MSLKIRENCNKKFQSLKHYIFEKDSVYILRRIRKNNTYINRYC